MSASQKGPIVSVGEFVENRGMRTLIESQANNQIGTVDNSKINGQNGPKVKRKGYVRINQPDKTK